MTREAHHRPTEKGVERRLDRSNNNHREIEIDHAKERLKSLKRKIGALLGMVNRYNNGEREIQKLLFSNLDDIQRENRALAKKISSILTNQKPALSEDLEKQLKRVEQIIADNPHLFEG